MNAICLVIDRLHPGYLGCYGNAWINTPHFDRLAADGFVFDQALAASPELEQQYELFAGGASILAAGADSPSSANIVARLRSAGLHTALITDDPSVAEMAWCASLDEIVRVEQRSATARVNEFHDTSLARLFAVVGQWLEAVAEPFCLWVHCGSLGLTWDAPQMLQADYRDPEDPPARADALVPEGHLAEDYDPDELLPITLAYAGQVTLLDICLGALVEQLDEMPIASRTLLTVFSARGFPLGEHRRVGAVDHALYAELIHTPWIVRLPDGCGASDRSQALVQPPDLAASLIDWFGLPPVAGASYGSSLLPIVRGERDAWRNCAFLTGPGQQRAVRTPAWYLRTQGDPALEGSSAATRTVELYAKPDDRWEVNDVADRCPEVVELLLDVLHRSLAAPAADPMPTLAEVLLAGLE